MGGFVAYLAEFCHAQDACQIAVDPNNTRAIRVETFSTEQDFDLLTVNGAEFSGTSGPSGVTPQGTILWGADSRGSTVARTWPFWEVVSRAHSYMHAWASKVARGCRLGMPRNGIWLAQVAAHPSSWTALLVSSPEASTFSPESKISSESAKP